MCPGKMIAKIIFSVNVSQNFIMSEQFWVLSGQLKYLILGMLVSLAHVLLLMAAHLLWRITYLSLRYCLKTTSQTNDKLCMSHARTRT